MSSLPQQFPRDPDERDEAGPSPVSQQSDSEPRAWCVATGEDAAPGGDAASEPEGVPATGAEGEAPPLEIVPQDESPHEALLTPAGAAEPIGVSISAQNDPGAVGAEAPLFESFAQPEIIRPAHIPHLGHVALLGLLLLMGLLASVIAFGLAMDFHLFGISDAQQASADIHYTLGSQVIVDLLTFAGCLLTFPPIWHMGFFKGIAWRGARAWQVSPILIGAAFVCFLLAIVNGWLMPGPTDAPIDRIFRVPGAAWLLFGFGVTFAPFFEEIAFRGFLLPAFCTACDWLAALFSIVKTHGNFEFGALGEASRALRPLDAEGQPQWSLTAMVVASIPTSLLFAGMHMSQTGNSLGPFLLLMFVSLVLCAARLWTRSLAASVLLHASYNFMLFSLMLFGTGGFRHLDNV